MAKLMIRWKHQEADGQRMTSHINQLITTTQTHHTETIQTIIEKPEKDVIKMQSKLEPWTEIDKEDTLELDVVTGHQGIPRIRRDEIDGLGRLEQQADIVVCLSLILYQEESREEGLMVRKRIMSLNRLD